MAKQYGNTGGSAQVPTSINSPGSWTAGTEIYRQKQVLSIWPAAKLPAAAPQTGEIVFCCSSGTRDELLETNKYIEASGQEVSRTAYPDLYEVLADTYGPGDGYSTFRLPNYTNENSYFKATTTSGETWVNLSGNAVLPSHTHVCQVGAQTNAAFNYTNDPAGPYVRDTGSSSEFTSVDESPEGNQIRRNQVFVLLTASGAGGNSEPGIVAPFLLPKSVDDFTGALTETLFVCSGGIESVGSNPVLTRQYGTLFGGDGSTTVGTPDYRGQFLNNVNKANSAVNVSGLSLGASGFLNFTTAAHRHEVNTRVPGSLKHQTNNQQSYSGPLFAPATSTASVGSLSTENRPANVNVLFMLTGG